MPITLRPNNAAPTRSEKAAAWIRVHGAQLALAAGLALLATALLVAILVNRGKLAERAADQLAIARGQAAAGKSKEAVATLDQVLQINRTSAGAMQAYVMKGEILMSERRWAEAEAVYKEALTQTTIGIYRPIFLGGQASASVEQKKWPDAISIYQRIIKEYPEHFLVPRSYMELGRLQEATQQWKEAQLTFERLVTLYPKSSWAPQAQAHLAELKSKLPPGK